LTVTPTGEPTPWERPASATLVLENIVLERVGGEGTVLLERFEITDRPVGWLPG
jgi:hypothetical protein